MHTEKRVYSETINFYVLQEGTRVLELTIYSHLGTAHTYLSRTVWRPVPNQVTRLYTKAFELMREEAGRIHKPIEYTFETEVPSLIAWAQSPEKGLSVVGSWDHTDLQNTKFVGKKTIYP